MAPTSSRREILTALAKEPSAEKRHGVLADIAHVFKAGKQFGLRDVQETGEALAKILPDLPEGDRRVLAERLAPMSEAPSYLIRTLSLDVPSVAEPVLAESPLLGEAELIEAMKKGSSIRLAAIARRPDLGPRLVSILVQIGDSRSLDDLLGNARVSLPEAAAVTLATRAKKDESLADRLIGRADIPVAELVDLFFTLTAHQRVRLSESLAARAGKCATPEAPKGAEALLLETLRAGDRDAFERALIDLCGIPDAIAERLTSDPSAEGMAVATLGLGLSRALYSTYAVLTRPEGAAESQRQTTMLDFFGKVSPAGARLMVETWRAGPRMKALPAPPKPAAAPRLAPAPPARPAAGPVTAKPAPRTKPVAPKPGGKGTGFGAPRQ